MSSLLFAHHGVSGSSRNHTVVGGSSEPSLSKRDVVVFLSCPLVKKPADLSGSFLYSQSTMKDMYSTPTNRTELSIPIKTKSIA